MSFAILTLALPLEIDNLECANISFPQFKRLLNLFKKGVSMEIKMAKDYGFCFGVKERYKSLKKSKQLDFWIAHS